MIKRYLNAIRGRIEYTLNGKQRVIEGVHTFDVDNVADVQTPSVSIDAGGSVVVACSGDEDTAKIYVTAAEDTDPPDPDGAGNEDGVVNGRSGTVDTGVSVARGSQGHVKVRGENAAGTLAPASTIKTGRASHTDDASQSFAYVALTKVEDDGTDDTYFLDWGVSGAVGSSVEGWFVHATLFRNDVAVEQRNFAPDSAPAEVTHSGGGDGSVDTHFARFLLWQDLVGDVGDRVYERIDTEAIGSTTTGGGGPSGLSVFHDVSNCEADLDWTPDDSNTQDVYRCTGDGCDPVVDGSVVGNDLAAGTGSFSEDIGPFVSGTVLRYQVKSTAGESNIAELTRGTCL